MTKILSFIGTAREFGEFLQKQKKEITREKTKKVFMKCTNFVVAKANCEKECASDGLYGAECCGCPFMKV